AVYRVADFLLAVGLVGVGGRRIVVTGRVVSSPVASGRVAGISALVDDYEHRTDLGFVALLDVDAGDDAGGTGGHLDYGLIGLQLHQWLVLVDAVALFDQHTDDGSGLDALAYVG